MEFIVELFKKLVVLAILGGIGFVGYQQYQKFVAQREAQAITAEKLMALKPGMTEADVEKLFGKPTKTTTGGSERENSARFCQQAGKFVYWRRGTVMMLFSKDGGLMEVCVGETTDDYYDRKAGKKVLWQEIQGNDFIHNDVMGSGGGVGTGIGGGAAGGVGVM